MSFQLSVQQLSCERGGIELFAGLDLAVTGGDIVQVAGPNGCGKSTLLKTLATLSSHYSGEINWCGESLHQVRLNFLSRLLYIGHKTGVKLQLTARENLAWLYPGPGSQIQIEEALAAMRLAGYEDRPCYTLSAGQQQRVALSRLLLSDAPLWLLDEPFTAIDKDGVEMLEGLLEKHARHGGAVVLTTHHTLGCEGMRTVNLQDYVPVAGVGT